MDFSDSFFNDSFRTVTTGTGSIPIPPPHLTGDLGSSTLSELVPSALSSSFDHLEWPENYSLGSRPSSENLLALMETREKDNGSPSLFMDEGTITSFAQALTSQATFSFQLETEDSARPAQPVAQFAEASASEKSASILTYYGVEDAKGLTSAMKAAVASVDVSEEPRLRVKKEPDLAAARSLSTLAPSAGILPSSAASASVLTRKSPADFKSHGEFKAYKVRRERNNEASRRSRTKFRQKARDMEDEVHDLRQENSDLKQQLNALNMAFEAMRQQVDSVADVM